MYVMGKLKDIAMLFALGVVVAILILAFLMALSVLGYGAQYVLDWLDPHALPWLFGVLCGALGVAVFVVLTETTRIRP